MYILYFHRMCFLTTVKINISKVLFKTFICITQTLGERDGLGAGVTVELESTTTVFGATNKCCLTFRQTRLIFNAQQMGQFIKNLIIYLVVFM